MNPSAISADENNLALSQRSIKWDACGVRALNPGLNSGASRTPGDMSHEEVMAAYRVPQALAQRSIVKMDKELVSIQPYPEAIAFLRHLDEQGIAWRILSNLATHYCKALTDALGITDDRCFFSCREGMLKPSSSFFELAARSLGLPKNEILMVGDAKRADVEGALGAGMHAFHMRRPYHDLWQAWEHFEALRRAEPACHAHSEPVL